MFLSWRRCCTSWEVVLAFLRGRLSFTHYGDPRRPYGNWPGWIFGAGPVSDLSGGGRGAMQCQTRDVGNFSTSFQVTMEIISSESNFRVGGNSEVGGLRSHLLRIGNRSQGDITYREDIHCPYALGTFSFVCCDGICGALHH